MTAPTITKPEEYFFVTKYEGNGGGQKVGKFVPFTDNGTIENSCIFNSPDSPVLSRTPSGTGTSKKTFTISAWIKNGRLINSASNHSRVIYGVNHGSSSRYSIFGLYSGGSGNPDKFRLFLGKYTTGSSTTGYDWITNRTLEDTSKWYHLMAVVDTTDATAGDRVKLYIDGDRVTSFASSSNPSLNDEFYFGSEYANYVSTYDGSFGDWDGYIAEFNFVDGTALTPNTFGVTDTSTGRWIPKTLSGITYGTNGFRLKFQDSSALGDDTSGNTNDFTATNLASTNQTTDSPTQNFMTFFLEDSAAGTLSQGNLLIDPHTNSGYRTRGTQKTIPQSGKWYMEVKLNVSSGTAYRNHSYGVLDLNQKQIQGLGTSVQFDAQVGGMGMGFNGDRIGFVSLYSTAYDWRLSASSPHSMVNGDFVLMAFDMDNGKAWWGTRDTSGTTTYWYNSSGGTDGDPSTGANPTFTFIPRNHRFMVCQGLYPDSGATLQWYFGSQGFNLTAPTDYGKLSQENFPETGKGIPDFMQIKNRDAADRWCWQDTLRGFGEYGSSASASPGSPVQFNSAISDGAQKSLKGGFTVEDSDYVNSSAESYVSFNWVANNGVSATDSSGNMPCELQANPTAGFSIAKFTVNGTGVRTWAHGLGKTPEFGHLWVYNTTPYGTTYHHKMSATPAQNYTFMSSSQARTGFTNGWGTSGPSSTLWSGTVGQLFSNGVPYIFYSWTGIEGYSKFESYVGNGNVDGPFVYLGFKPRYIWIKNTSATSNYAFDTVRFPNNPNGENVVYDGAYSEASTGNEVIDFLSNGFKIRTTSSGTNTNGTTYIYGAFAEHPFYDGASFATAR